MINSWYANDIIKLPTLLKTARLNKFLSENMKVDGQNKNFGAILISNFGITLTLAVLHSNQLSTLKQTVT